LAAKVSVPRIKINAAARKILFTSAEDITVDQAPGGI
jgi:hypothetical protein